MLYISVTKKQYLQVFLKYNEKKLSGESAVLEKNTLFNTNEEEETYKKIQLE